MTVLAFYGVGCVHLSSVAVTVLMTSWSSVCLAKRSLHHRFLALTTLRTEVMLEFFAKVDDDPHWFPGEHTGTKRGVERVRNAVLEQNEECGQAPNFQRKPLPV